MEQSEKVHAIDPQKLKRWRLILGTASENTLGNMAKDEVSLSKEQTLMDQALAALYDNTEGADTLLGAGNGASSPNISKWLGDIRALFDKEIVTVIQNDAIERNLKNYNKTLKTIVPDRVFFYDRASKMNKWNVILDVDQSGSMSQSVIYSSVMSCILASMNSIKNRIVAFDTEVVDLTEKSGDPVDLLYGFNLGGGTDINKSVVYCEQFIETPKKTLFFLITDLCEGGNHAALIRRLGEMKQAGVTVICLLAIADKGAPYYDKDMANRVAKLGIPCFACSPEKLPQLFEAALKGHELSQFIKK